jgi:hypothetical protein
MSRGWTYKSGVWNVICDRCAMQVKSDQIMKEWTGFLVCPSCYENRHPQDFLKARLDKISVPFSRPEPPDVFTTVNYIVGLGCTTSSSTSIADSATSGCARSGIPLQGGL